VQWPISEVKFIHIRFIKLLKRHNQYTDYPVISKSLYRSCTGSHFHGTENDILADFGPVGNTENIKKI
jgi:hypothetical protein